MNINDFKSVIPIFKKIGSKIKIWRNDPKFRQIHSKMHMKTEADLRSHDFIFSRDSKALKWRFINHPNSYKLYYLRKEKEIIGYLSYRILYGNGITNLVIADYLFLKGNENKLQSLLNRVLKDSIQENVTTIKVWCPHDSPYFRILRDFGFMNGGNIPVISYQNEFALEIQTGCKNWHFTISDSDNI